MPSDFRTKTTMGNVKIKENSFIEVVFSFLNFGETHAIDAPDTKRFSSHYDHWSFPDGSDHSGDLSN